METQLIAVYDKWNKVSCSKLTETECYLRVAKKTPHIDVHVMAERLMQLIGWKMLEENLLEAAENLRSTAITSVRINILTEPLWWGLDKRFFNVIVPQSRL